MIKRWEWLILIFLAAGGVFSWYRLSLPRYQSIDLSISQTKAVDIAKKFLQTNRGIDIKGYRTAVTFNVDESTDRYLQRTLGITGSGALIRKLHYDLFSWGVRFFKEKQKEEYKVGVSSASGEVIGYNHIIEDTASRPFADKDKSRQLALDFLHTTYGGNPGQYILHGEDVHKFDNRQDYAFSWQDKNVQIPWSKNKDKGYAKLLTLVTVSGNEILGFSKSFFEIPDGFNRYVENLKQTGQNLTLCFRILYLALMTFAIVVVVNRKHQVVARQVKPFYISVGIAMFVLLILDVLNNYQDLLFAYPTTQSLGDYVVRQIIDNIISPFFIAVGFVLPALAGESLRYETCGGQKNRGILSTLLSSFCSVNIAHQIFIGYLAAAFILGMQAFIFNLGFKYCGVWDELSWLSQASTTLIPAFTAMVIGFQASFSEESMFRLFAINLFKKYGVPTFLAVFSGAAIWGFGHTGYEIFPMWFRGVEVTCIGVIMGVCYLRYGLISVIAAHYLIDSFYYSLPLLLNARVHFNFYTGLGVVSLPVGLALIALALNRNTPERPLSIRFTPQQQFNYSLLQELCRHKTPEELLVLKKDLQRHGWDQAIINRVFESKA